MSMSHAEEQGDALEWILTGFSARDVAEPLLSVDAGSSRDAALAIFQANNVDVLGVRTGGTIRGWIGKEDLQAAEVTTLHSFDPVTLVADTSSLNEVVCLLNKHERLYVRAFGQ